MSTIEKSPVQKLQDDREYQARREAVLRDPRFIAREKEIQEDIARYKKTEAFQRYLQRDPAEREEEWRKLVEAGIAKDPVDAYMDSAEYKAHEEFKRETMERYKQTDRYKEYEKRKLAEQNNEAAEPQS